MCIRDRNDDGDHVGGVTGVLKSIGYAIRQTQPTRVIVVFDGKGGSQRRKKRFSGYKSQRESNKLRVNRQYADLMNDEDERESMKRQYVWLNEILDYLPIQTMIYDGVEADDIMAYISTQLLKENEQAVVMSTDKDFLQLVDDKTIVWSPTKKKLYNKGLFDEQSKNYKEKILEESKKIISIKDLLGKDSKIEENKIKPGFNLNVDSINLGSDKLVGIAPFAKHVAKMYPLDLMQKIVSYIQDKHTVFLFGYGKIEMQKNPKIMESNLKDLSNN